MVLEKETLISNSSVCDKNLHVFLEMRTKFDHGEDPMDPESQQGHHHHHFHGFQGFNPFGSGPFNFKFNFN